MRSGDTSLGGPAGRFPETEQELVSGLRDPNAAEYRVALDELCARYWKPVYAYLRVGWAKTNDDAKDLAQAFFLWLSESDVLGRFEPTRGGFRPYLKALLRNFVANNDRALGRLKRGGAVRVLSLEGEIPDVDRLLASPDAVDPETLFERVWRTELIQRAMGRLREACAAENRSVAYSVFEAYDLVAPALRPTYKELAVRLGLSEPEVKKHLFEIREAARRELRAELARSSGGDENLENEWKTLFGA